MRGSPTKIHARENSDVQHLPSCPVVVLLYSLKSAHVLLLPAEELLTFFIVQSRCRLSSSQTFENSLLSPVCVRVCVVVVYFRPLRALGFTNGAPSGSMEDPEQRLRYERH